MTAAGAGDDGRADPRLAAAMAADDGTPGRRSEVLAALATARVFLPLAARVLVREPSADHESSAEMALLSLVSTSGARALPAFLDGTDVQRWRPEARPVPVRGPDACRTVLDDGARALLLEPGGAAVVVDGDALVELASGRVPVLGAALSSRSTQLAEAAGAAVPDALLAALGRALAPEGVTSARVLAGPDGPVVGLVLDAGPVDPGELAGLADRLRARLGADLPAEGLDLAVVAPGGAGQPVPLPGRRGRLGRGGRLGRRGLLGHRD